MTPHYGLASLRDVRDNEGPGLRYLLSFTDGGALAVSGDGTLAGWIEHDFDCWVLARSVDWASVTKAAQFTVVAVCTVLDSALGESEPAPDG